MNNTSVREDFDLNAISHFHWNENGFASLGGELEQIFNELDALFCSWAKLSKATQYQFPSLIDARELARIGYFESFPHLVTFAVCPERSQESLEHFAKNPFNRDGNIDLPCAQPIEQLLTPAACYHFYVQQQNKRMEQPQYFTTRCQCFRREKAYLPLQRQWNFHMREIVCIGTEEDVARFLDEYRTRLTKFIKEVNLPLRFESATDPFFNPAQSPKYLMQKLDPVKTELIFEDGLSVASINLHRNYFGEAFNITASNGEPAYSGCVAFGLERWLYMYLRTYGLESGHFSQNRIRACGNE